jgi:hypothetical protein
MPECDFIVHRAAPRWQPVLLQESLNLTSACWGVRIAELMEMNARWLALPLTEWQTEQALLELGLRSRDYMGPKTTFSTQHNARYTDPFVISSRHYLSFIGTIPKALPLNNEDLSALQRPMDWCRKTTAGGESCCCCSYCCFGKRRKLLMVMDTSTVSQIRECLVWGVKV